MGWPDGQPTNGLYAARAFYFLEKDDPEAAWRLYSDCYRRYWVDAQACDTPEAVADIGARLGHDRADLLAGLQSQAAKDKTRHANDDAVAKGVFGSPFVIVDGEPFWGFDRFAQIDAWLRRGGW